MYPITLILAEDSKLVRQGMHSLLDANPNYQVLGEAENGNEALQLIETLHPDVAILDMVMPGLNGLEVIKHVKENGWQTQMIVVSMHANATYAVRALLGGALSYVLKDSDFTEIEQATETAAHGKRYLSPLIADDVLGMLLHASLENTNSLDMLSKREIEVLQLIAEGNTNATIAEKLLLSVRTVEAHRAHIMSKLRLTSHVDLVKFAINQGLTVA